MLLSTLAFVGCQSKAEKVKKLQDQYNAEYPAYAKDASMKTSDSARMLTGEKLTGEQMADPRSEEERTRRTVQTRGRPSCRKSITDSCSTTVARYRCASTRTPTANERINNEETDSHCICHRNCYGLATL